MSVFGVIPRNELREEGAAIFLRPCRHEDGDAIYEAAWESREHVGAWMPWLGADYCLSDAVEWAGETEGDWKLGKRFEFVMLGVGSGRLCGVCGLNQVNETDLVCNLGYWVRRSELRRGVATAAVKLLRDFGLGVLGMERLEIVEAVGNEASQGVARRVGAREEGVQRKRLKVGLVSSDAVMFALVGES
ncbi:MAG: GNAT family protein [Verrucomicrobiota bacterium]